MQIIDRRQFIAGLVAGATGAAASGAWAQDSYPAKGPVRLIVPQPAGGAADASARMLAALLQERLKQVFIIDNRPGASFLLGMQGIAQAAPDGYTLMHINPGMCAAQASLKKFDLRKTLAPISLSASAPAVLCVPAASPARTARELLAFGHANPGKLNYGSVGIGTLEHLWCHNLSKEHGLEAVHIPFKGMPDAATALVGGDVQFLPTVYPVAAPLVQKGLIRPLAMLDDRRHRGMPDVPTLKELGIAAPNLVFWSGIAAPAGTPAAIVELLRREIAGAASDTGYRERLEGIGATALGSETAQSFDKLIEDDLTWLNAAVKAANLQLN